MQKKESETEKHREELKSICQNMSSKRKMFKEEREGRKNEKEKQKKNRIERKESNTERDEEEVEIYLSRNVKWGNSKCLMMRGRQRK